MHIKYVIRRSLEFASQLENIDIEMVYVIAAFHDIGHHINPEKHEIISAQMLVEDKKIKEFFTDEKIKIMKEAIEDHRASTKAEPRNIYGKIVSSADRNTNVEVTLRRSYSYNRNFYKNLPVHDVIKECRTYLNKKFGTNGYAKTKMYFKDEEYNQYLKDMEILLNNEEEFAKQIKKVNNL